eukprot:CAMPEP_0201896606 /NCGR_PEP_ID=MMETSP0902-20130614/44963_1 /ASSEMBLY_ACC=CAM_ASM_000551 /TAXON_ID=420261 /ORGANISM="Thalassiosira antarctica, Strain CCMP982" /LENGTH=321 /DNA_ID=CAMNT_0048429245 /DNA_START=319 /DNA_END=1284 /DNA_ORIENTATION=-
MPSRINYIRPTLESLLFHQTTTVDEIYLTLGSRSLGSAETIQGGQYNRDTIPSFIGNWSDQGLLTVLTPETDFGPVDKLLLVLIQESNRSGSNSNTRILYLDDDVIYPPHLVHSLYRASERHPKSAVAFSGSKLRSHFRQIKHSHERRDCHPNLYFRVGGVDCHEDREVDIVQGFMGVMVRLGFFDVSEFVELVRDDTMPLGVRKSDDWLISAHLERRNVKRVLVPPHDASVDNAPQLNPVASKKDALSAYGMHENAMTAASYLQQRLGIWNNYTFAHVSAFSEDMLDLLYCEAGLRRRCPNGESYLSVTAKLDQALNIST